jgi:hypothetical protein
MMVCLWCGAAAPPGSQPLGTYCKGCGKSLILTPEKPVPPSRPPRRPGRRVTGRGGGIYLNGARVGELVIDEYDPRR